MKNNQFQMTGFLTRFTLKKDHLKLLVWAVVLISLFVGVASKFTSLYGNRQAIDEIIKTLKTPAMVSLFGKMPKNAFTSADVFAAEMTVFMAIISCIMNYYFVIRNTRGEEESGILEMIQAHSVGRLANLSATIVESFLLNFGIGLIYALGLQFANLSGTDLNGNFLLGLGLASCGFMFAGIATVVSQLSDNTRNTTTLAYLVFGIMYIARMITDVTNPHYTWFVPLGWVEKFSTYQQNNWLPVILMLVLSVILVLTAFYLNLHRDLGSGLIATKPGRASASPLLHDPLTLFWRLNRVSILVWFFGILILGMTYGSIFNTIGDIVKTNPMFKQLLSTSAIDNANLLIVKQFIGVLMIVFAVLALIPGISLINYLKKGEDKGYLEIIHATPTSRLKLYSSMVFLSVITMTIIFFAGNLGLYLGGNAVMKQNLPLEIFQRNLLGYWPATMIFLGISACLVGWLPKLISLNFGYLIISFFIQYFGKLLKLPDWTEKLTPFGYLTKVPVKDFNPTTFWFQLALALILIVIGYIGYRRRDLVIN
ncbi:ABC transporter permease [Companilactobacillus sp. HBUAS59544]|uniref:ABC transporter permease n=1 Tax=Companilactobacillus sp. HBUAS59544 TaxID=3109363 RepID=UPI002FF0F703